MKTNKKQLAEVINFKLSYKGASISASYTFGPNDDNGTLTFQNPVSGSSNENIDTVLWGWSEQNPELQAEWIKLVELAKEFCDSELYFKINDGGVYNLEETE
jgi:hypothetical protein